MNITITIDRFTGDSQEKKVDSFTLPYRDGMTVLDALQFIHEQLDPTLAYRYECRSGICGTCGLMLNGIPVLSCTTQLDSHKKEHHLSPLAHFPVERDLIVNIEPVLERYKKIKPYLEQTKKAVISKKVANESKPFRKCIECGCCIAGSAVSTTQNPDEVLDPMALVKIARYVTDPRDGLNRKALAQQYGIEKYSDEEGSNLSAICPRGVPIDEAIKLLKLKQ